jgi:maltose O-acetyltransferase
MSPIRKLRQKLNRVPDVDGLVKRGLRIGSNVNLQFGVIIDHSHCHLISIGDDCILAPNVHLLAHDASTKLHLGYTRLARVIIGNRVFIGAGSIILPGVTVGDGAIVAAGSLVSRDVAPGTLVGGNPARFIKTVDDYIVQNRELMKTRPCWPQAGWHTGHGLTDARRLEQWDALDEVGFLE